VNTIRFHPLADLFPLLTGKALDDLANDIRANGLREPIWLDEEGRILDGRNRLRACIQAGVEPEFRTWRGPGSLITFVISKNVRRRHLSGGQAACIALALLPHLEEEARKRMEATQAQPGEQVGAKGTEVIPGPVPDAGEARERAAALIGINPHYISDVKKLYRQNGPLFDEVRTGRKSLPAAMRELEALKNPAAAPPPRETTAVPSPIVEPPSEDQKAAMNGGNALESFAKSIAGVSPVTAVRGANPNELASWKESLKIAVPWIETLATEMNAQEGKRR
jgi:ParB-like nuclease domain